MKYVLALDQGTTSSRAILFDAGGRAVASAQRELTQHFPQPGWVEHDPDEIWRTQLACGREALAGAGIAPGDVAAIGITNQRETTLLWERTSGRPLAPAIVWQDRRTAGRCAELQGRRLREAVPQPDRARPRPLLFRDQAGLAARRDSRGETTRRTRRAGLRHDR